MHCCSHPYFNWVAEYKLLHEFTGSEYLQSVRFVPTLGGLVGPIYKVDSSDKCCLQPMLPTAENKSRIF